ncbi:hypothetical protein MLD38_024001 [Melastoma candidum]|uniref:Uncharacterized protein n=1 Tax=Melastoma candidum TaxID=119954 RepID=A0ACB9NR24_9MYRT|nr:hypothetical protein MLD38_024001 [Melastoma candidum]
MSPSQFYFDGDDARNADNDATVGGPTYPPPLGVSKGSHCIKKSSSLLSSGVGRNGGDRGRPHGNSNSGGSNGKAGQHHHPVIIYTHSPKVIQTHPRDFMALVQKLTGMSQSEEEDVGASTLKAKMEDHDPDVNRSAAGRHGGGSEDTDASSVLTEEHGVADHGQVNSCFMPPALDLQANVSLNVPFYVSNKPDILLSNNQPVHYNLGDPTLFNFIPNNNARNTLTYPDFRS